MASVTNITINKKLNLVIPVEVEDQTIYFYSTPISREIFEAHYMLMVKTLSNLYYNGIGPGMAPRVARLAMKDIAKDMNDKIDVSIPIIQEIYRLTFVLMIDPTIGNKWRPLPYLEVKNKKLVDEDVLTEVENALVYFTVASSVHLKSELPVVMSGLSTIWGAQTTLSNPMEYCNSLTMPTQEENTGEKEPPTQSTMVRKVSSIPS